jgi:hypothetical protein
MKKLTLFLAFLASLASAQLPVFQVAKAPPMGLGGNVYALRPAYTDADHAIAEMSCAAIAGKVGRFSTIAWETFWNPDPATANYRGIDADIDLAAKYKITPLFLLEFAPHPTSLWYVGKPNSDWWNPPSWTFPQIKADTSAMVAHINQKCTEAGILPYYQLLNEPAGRNTNPYENEKPGGSNQTAFGEWAPNLTGLMQAEIDALHDNGVGAYRIVYPSVSCIGERREAIELKTSITPILAQCGWVDIHFRWSAGWAVDPATRLAEVTRGFGLNADYLQTIIDHTPEYRGKRIMISEMYVTPGDCGANIGDDLNPYREVAVGLCKKHGWLPICWGLTPEGDNPGDKWNTFSGWLDYFKSAVVK